MTPKLIDHPKTYSEELLPGEIKTLISAEVIYRCKVCPALIGDSIYHPFGEHGDKTFPEIKQLLHDGLERCAIHGTFLPCTICQGGNDDGKR